MLRVLDVSDGTAPVEVGSLGGLDDGQDIVVSGNLAYIAESPLSPPFGGGLRIVDVSVPGSLTVVGHTGEPAPAQGVALTGGYAYVAAGENGLYVVDVSDPAAPTAVGHYDTPGEARAVTVAGTLAYVADGAMGLCIVDVSDAAAPVAISSYFPYGSGIDVAVEGTLAYVSTNWMLAVVDVTDPAKPRLLGALGTGGEGQVEAANGLAYVTVQGSGLFIVRYVMPATVDIAPDSLDPKSKGMWVTAYVELIEGYDPGEIDVATVRLDSVIAAELRPVSVGDDDGDTVPDLTVKFSRQALIDYLGGTTGEVTLTVRGQLVDGTFFEGRDTLLVH
jgi:hypothetical protein